MNTLFIYSLVKKLFNRFLHLNVGNWFQIGERIRGYIDFVFQDHHSIEFILRILSQIPRALLILSLSARSLTSWFGFVERGLCRKQPIDWWKLFHVCKFDNPKNGFISNYFKCIRFWLSSFGFRYRRLYYVFISFVIVRTK